MTWTYYIRSFGYNTGCIQSDFEGLWDFVISGFGCMWQPLSCVSEVHLWHFADIFFQFSSLHFLFHFWTLHSGELWTQKMKSNLIRTQSIKVGVSQCIAIHATHTARDFFLANFYPSVSFTCFYKTSPEFFLWWQWLTPVPVWACRIK